MDYAKLGLKVGLEIHQQLDTHKLFCNCSSVMQEGKPDMVIRRNLHAVAGELGLVDPAALQAYLRGREYVYKFFKDSNCLVELDEEPPHALNEEALETGLLVSLMLNAKLVDEVQVMRKTVIDGSNTSGFQRTSLIAMDGTLEFGGKKIGILSLCLEEDAARIVETTENEVVYNLDRLGVPLIEIATAPDIKSPDEAKQVAHALGDILRATRRVKRGIGTIRQDLNISIKGGSRIEVKGVQDLRLISKVVENEAMRQVELLEIRDELKKRVKKLEPKIMDVSDIFKKSESKVIKTALKNGGVVLSIKLDGFAGLLGKEVQPARRLGTELADYAKAYGSKGLFHSDELPAYGVTENEILALKKKIGCTDKDGFVLIAESEKTAKKSIDAVIKRAQIVLEGVPHETRKALPDGNSAYTRPLPGASRMYPETDLPSHVINEKLLSSLKKKLPEMPWKQIENLGKKYSISKELASDIYRTNLDAFEKLVKETKADSGIVATTLTATLRSIEKPDIELGYDHYKELFISLSKNKFSKEAIPEILETWFKKPDAKLDSIVSKLGISSISNTEVEKIIAKVVEKNQAMVKERGERAIQPLMGEVMKEVRGKADGKTVMEILRKLVK